MQMRYVSQTAEEGGIGLQGVKVRIDRNPEHVGEGFPYLASTSDDGRVITLFPNSFKDTRTLVETLGHERQHVFQRQSYGRDVSWDTLNSWEDAAYTLEGDFWKYYQQNKSGKLDKFQ
ncbi:hypothetical protein A3194_12600 [Candidatus Thiodiazotropha endoloripes]|nr:hypothetical protein A3194_12600 [Candidatus Thiodiazotropha endoloripes]